MTMLPVSVALCLALSAVVIQGLHLDNRTVHHNHTDTAVGFPSLGHNDWQ